MKKLPPGIHGVLDYFTVLLLLMSPTLFGMSHTGSVFTYTLATIHLILTLFTDFPAGVFRIVPLRVHGLIEITVSIGLVCVAALFKTSGDNFSFYFYLVFAGVLLTVWFLSDYKMPAKSSS